MVEKAERLVLCQRRQPEREPRELHGSRISVDAVQTSPRDEAAVGRVQALIEIVLSEASLFDERSLPRAQTTIRGYWKHGRAGNEE